MFNYCSWPDAWAAARGSPGQFSGRALPGNFRYLFPSMNEWNIQSRAHACTTCARPFADQQPFHTLLLTEASQLRRTDICEECWQKQASQIASSHEGFISHWHGVYQVPPPVTEVIQKENAETLLRKIIELNDPVHAPAAYILAVMLERKRLLKVKEQFKREGRRVFVYEHPKTGDIFTIADPDLQLHQLETVQRDVAHLLEHGLNLPAPAAESPAPAEGDVPAETAVEPPTEASPEAPVAAEAAPAVTSAT